MHINTSSKCIASDMNSPNPCLLAQKLICPSLFRMSAATTGTVRTIKAYIIGECQKNKKNNFMLLLFFNYILNFN